MFAARKAFMIQFDVNCVHLLEFSSSSFLRNELATPHDGKRTAPRRRRRRAQPLTNHAGDAGGLLAPPPPRPDAHDGRLGEQQLFAPTGGNDDDGRSSSGHDDGLSRQGWQ